MAAIRPKQPLAYVRAAAHPGQTQTETPTLKVIPKHKIEK